VFGLRKQPLTTGAFALGKFPGHPEFLRTEDELGATLDAWLDAGWQGAHAVHGAEWAPAFAGGAVYGFLWRPAGKTEKVACGVIAPSADSLGRAYPLVVGCPLPTPLITACWPFSPTAAGRLLDEAYGLMVDAGSTAFTRDDMAHRLQELRSPTVEEYQAAEVEHSAWCDEVTVSEGWQPVFAHGGGLRGAGAVLEGLEEAIRPLARRERPVSSVLLRLPLGEGGSTATTLWLDIVQRIAQWKQTVPSVFWAAEGGTLLLAIAPPGPSLIGQLWRADPHDEHVFDLSNSDGENSSLASEVSRLVVERPDAPMSALLGLLGR
jgi:type VI secretion system ImpM family protein